MPDEATWEDVEWDWKDSRADGYWRPCQSQLVSYDVDEWGNADDEANRQFRLSTKYGFQPITYAQFRALLDKPAEPVLYREDVECYLYVWQMPHGSSKRWEYNSEPNWKFRNRHTQKSITREQFIQAIINSEEREAKRNLPVAPTPLESAVRRLVKLYDDPHPGLATWNTMLQRQIEEVRRLT